MLKRLFDIVFSLFGLIVLSPFLFALAILIKREDGDLFFIVERE
jgi:lipopolysaccharide/colanic/teichoic acid biosynthesis glycosyltransferase